MPFIENIALARNVYAAAGFVALSVQQLLSQSPAEPPQTELLATVDPPQDPIPASIKDIISAMPVSHAPLCPSDLFRWASCELDQPAPPSNIFKPEEAEYHSRCIPRTLRHPICHHPMDDWVDTVTTAKSAWLLKMELSNPPCNLFYLVFLFFLATCLWRVWGRSIFRNTSVVHLLAVGTPSSSEISSSSPLFPHISAEVTPHVARSSTPDLCDDSPLPGSPSEPSLIDTPSPLTAISRPLTSIAQSFLPSPDSVLELLDPDSLFATSPAGFTEVTLPPSSVPSVQQDVVQSTTAKRPPRASGSLYAKYHLAPASDNPLPAYCAPAHGLETIYSASESSISSLGSCNFPPPEDVKECVAPTSHSEKVLASALPVASSDVDVEPAILAPTEAAVPESTQAVPTEATSPVPMNATTTASGANHLTSRVATRLPRPRQVSANAKIAMPVPHVPVVASHPVPSYPRLSTAQQASSNEPAVPVVLTATASTVAAPRPRRLSDDRRPSYFPSGPSQSQQSQTKRNHSRANSASSRQER